MEVLQTSALPLGDGAGRNSIDAGKVRPRLSAGATTARATAGIVRHGVLSVHLRGCAATGDILRVPLVHLACHPKLAEGERRMERETGFEPATSTLARSHSTTELFPPATKPKRTTRVSAESRQPSRP